MASLFTIDSDGRRYHVIRKIAEGGMGLVYEAEEHDSRGSIRPVAIKVLRQQHASQRQFVQNFIGEAKLATNLIHPNIVQTYRLAEAKGIYFIVMELIRGINLEEFTQRLREKGEKVPVETSLFIASRIAHALAYAHARTDQHGRPLGIVHRDVSFRNIMLSLEGDVKLIDFGIAKARRFLADSESEIVAGKADFISPEQANFHITDRRSDIFSAGAVLGHLLLGNASQSETADSREGIIHLPDLRRLDERVDNRVKHILQRTLAQDPNRRYSNADELLQDLEGYINDHGYISGNHDLGKLLADPSHQEHADAGGKVSFEVTLLEKHIDNYQRLSGDAVSASESTRSLVPEIDPAPSHLVRFSAFLPERVRSSTAFAIQAWAYLQSQHEQVLAKASRIIGAKEAGTAGPTPVSLGEPITFFLVLEGFTVDQPRQTIHWDGQPACVTFPVTAPRASDAPLGQYQGIIKISRSGPPIASVAFSLIVGKDQEPATREQIAKHIRSIFASYAEEDRTRVIDYARGARDSGTDVFLDVLSLRVGQNWAHELVNAVPSKDQFCLFWSRPASQSEWVEKEWRCALAQRGIDYIHPVPYADPRDVPPPPELAAYKHFHDLWMMVYEYERLRPTSARA